MRRRRLARADVELERGAQRGGGLAVEASTRRDGLGHGEPDRGGDGGRIGDARASGQLGGDGGPAGVEVAAGEVEAAQAGRASRVHQRADDAHAVAQAHGEVGEAARAQLVDERGLGRLVGEDDADPGATAAAGPA